MTNDLVDIVLSSSGQVLDELLVDRAVAQVRAKAGWHIAPVRTETITVTHFGGSPYLVLPTRRAVSVAAVRRDGVAVSTGYVLLAGGMLYAATRRGWDFGTYEVDLTHGYPECPPEIVALVAAVAENAGQARTLSAQTTGPFSVSYPTDAPNLRDDPDLDRYALPSAVA